MDIAVEIRAAKARKGVTLDDLAKAMGTTRETVSRKMRGITPLSWDDVLAFAKALDTTPSALVADAEKHAASAV